MVYFQTKNTNLGKFWRALHRLENVNMFYGHLEYFADIGIIYGHLVHFSGFGTMHQEKSGNPGVHSQLKSAAKKSPSYIISKKVPTHPGAGSFNLGVNVHTYLGSKP
jgi:hypothetical protein